MSEPTTWWCRCPSSFGRPDENGQSIVRSGEWIQAVNRWAAFSDDDLAALTEATDYLMRGDDLERLEYLHRILDGITLEITDELARRKAAE